MFDGKAFGQEIVSVVKEYVERQNAPLLKRIDELEEKVRTVETRGLHYCGAYQRAAGYTHGSVVTHDGSAWIALGIVAPGEAPGTASNRWQLMVKRGRDGKDAR